MTAKTIVCLKWGSGAYPGFWVDKLYRAVERNLTPPFNFVCFTDDPTGIEEPNVDIRDVEALTMGPRMREFWWKLALAHPVAELEGTCLFLDLDIVIVASLDPFFEVEGRYCMIREDDSWRNPHKRWIEPRPIRVGNSSVYRFEAGAEPELAEVFLRDPDYAEYSFRNEQTFMTHAVGLGKLRWWDSKWICNYKRHCVPAFPQNLYKAPEVPEGARILIFNGHPKQDVAFKEGRGMLSGRILPNRELLAHWS